MCVTSTYTDILKVVFLCTHQLIYVYIYPAASEYRSWTLFYAIPVLRGVLSDKYFQHFVLFSEALWLLLQSAPSLEDVAMAERLLQHFCMKFAAYYGKVLQVLSYVFWFYSPSALMVCVGERYYTANVHHLLHFADSVRNLGPLWAHSAFPFEDTNGWLGDLFHGSRDPQKQVCVCVCVCVCL